ncbi:hypothetical protein ACS127_08480 [Amphibacillus sp. Q70]
MNRIYGMWNGRLCKKKEHYVHIQALIDYSILFNPLISNKAAR